MFPSALTLHRTTSLRFFISPVSAAHSLGRRRPLFVCVCISAFQLFLGRSCLSCALFLSRTPFSFSFVNPHYPLLPKLLRLCPLVGHCTRDSLGGGADWSGIQNKHAPYVVDFPTSLFCFAPARRCARSHLLRSLRCFFFFCSSHASSYAWTALTYAHVCACALVSSYCCCCCQRADRPLGLSSSASKLSPSPFSLLCLYAFGVSCSPSHISLPLSHLIASVTAPRQTL